MKIGVFVPLASPFADADFVRTAGTAAEDRGFDSLWVAEHVVLFDDYESRYPYAADGRIPVAADTGFLDNFSSLTYLAAVTERIRLGTGICLVPQRNPVYTAKEAANVDWLSRGRLDFGVGVGWLAEEFGAVNVPFERRGARCRSYLEVIRRLWCNDVSAYEDEFYRLEPCRQFPKPIQSPHPPIHFGGESDAALRRVADLGQGWYGFNLTPDALVERLEQLRKLLEPRGRSLADVTISVSPYLQGCDRERLEAYAAAGADQVILSGFASDRDGLLRTLDQLATEFVEHARGL